MNILTAPYIDPDYVGWRNGGGVCGLEVEVFVDFLSEDSAMAYKNFNDALQIEIMPGMTYLDGIDLKVSNYPEKGLAHVFEVAQGVIYFMDLCSNDSSDCRMNEYMRYSWLQMPAILYMQDMDRDDFVNYWVSLVAAQFHVPDYELLFMYNPTYDSHKSMERTFLARDYAEDKGVTTTPAAFLNGERVENMPSSMEEWLMLFDAAYAAQPTHDCGTKPDQASAIASLLA